MNKIVFKSPDGKILKEIKSDIIPRFGGKVMFTDWDGVVGCVNYHYHEDRNLDFTEICLSEVQLKIKEDEDNG